MSKNMHPHASELKTTLLEQRRALRDGLMDATAAVGAAHRERLRWVLSCDRAELWRRDGCRNMAQWLSGNVGISNWKARRWVGAAYALEHLVHIAAALENGSLSLDKAVELTRFATPATEQDLISWARMVNVSRVRQRADEETSRALKEVGDDHGSRRLEWSWDAEGARLGFHGELPADQAAVFVEAIDRVAQSLPSMPDDSPLGDLGLSKEELTIAQRRADALVLMASSQAGDRKAVDRTELVLHVTLEALAGDDGSLPFGRGMLHPETARRLSCDARLQVVLHGTDGAP